MNTIKKNRYYRKAIDDLSVNKNNNITNFLKNENLTILEFLKNLGLNDDLIKPFNYQEIESFAKDVLEFDGLPIISSPMKGKNGNDNISIYNKENDSDLVVKENAIDFNFNYKDENKARSIMIVFSLLDGNFKKKTVETTVIYKYENNYNFVSKFFIKASEVISNSNGELLNDRSYNIEITGPISMNQYAVINRSLMSDSILPGIYSVLKLLEEGKLKRENVVIKLNIPGLQEKVSK